MGRNRLQFVVVVLIHAMQISLEPNSLEIARSEKWCDEHFLLLQSLRQINV